ncbi:MAG: hypothetical protein ACLGSD_19715 [Acidobacteriota bacterium]
MREPRDMAVEAVERGEDGPEGSRPDLDRKYWIAMALYGVLAVLAWFTIGEGTVMVGSRPVEIRWIPIAVLGLFVVRTYVARQADRVRRGE